MSSPREYDFFERLGMSHGIAEGARVDAILLSNIPGALKVRKASKSEDRAGTDWWVDTASGRALSIDAKVRSEDWAKRGEDDLALETWSVVETGKVGWTRDETKRTDYILWLWTDTGRWCLVPFPMLLRIFQDNWITWRERFMHPKQSSGQWTSECVFVPRREVWAEIYRTFGGGRIAA